MGDVRMKRARWLSALAMSRIGYAVGCLTASAGAGIEFGTGFGLIVGGVIGAASCLLLVDVGEKGAPMAGDDL